MIGKGNRSDDVIKAMKEYGAVYFAAIGGAGALYSKCVEECNVIAFEDRVMKSKVISIDKESRLRSHEISMLGIDGKQLCKYERRT